MCGSRTLVKSSVISCGCVVVGLAAAACQDRAECPARECPVVDESAAPTDIRIELAPGSVARLTLENESGDEVVDGGEVVLSSEDPWCVPTSEVECTIALKRLNVFFGSVSLETNVGAVELHNLSLSVGAPVLLTMEDFNLGYHIPPGVEVHTCLEVDGRRDHAAAALNAEATLRFDAREELLTVDASLPLAFHLAGDECERLQGEVSFMLAGRSPWAQFPDGMRQD